MFILKNEKKIVYRSSIQQFLKFSLLLSILFLVISCGVNENVQNSVNDSPSFKKGSDQQIVEDSASQIVTEWATSISKGSDEESQTLTFIVTTNNDTLFSELPFINSTTGTLTYTPEADANGNAVVTVTLKDDGGTENGGIDYTTDTFNITITPQEDLPTAKTSNITVTEASTYQFRLSDFYYNDVDGDSMVSICITTLATSGTLKLSGVDVALNQVIEASDISSGELTYTPDLNEMEENFSYTVNDGNNDSDSSSSLFIYDLSCPKILKEGNPEYLPDFSYAGYKSGDESIPEPAVDAVYYHVTATPDDGVDDTVAILETINAANNDDSNSDVIVKFPKGRFILNNIIEIKRSNFILLGEGSGADGTILYVPIPISEMDDRPQEIKDDEAKFHADRAANGSPPYSYFSWMGGVIWTSADKGKPYYPNKFILSGKRGENSVIVDDENGTDDFFKDNIEGKTFFIRWYNNGHKDSEMIKHILDDQDVTVGNEYESNNPYIMATQTVTATAINGNVLTIKERLAHDIRPEWVPDEDHKFKIAFNSYFNDSHQGSYLENVGIQGFSILFPESVYKGHHQEDGYNGIYLTELLNSWVKDIKVTNADSGFLNDGLKYVTIEDITVDGRGGHYTASVGDSNYVLVKNFTFNAKALHNPSFNSNSLLNVYSDGFVTEPKFDQHMGMNCQNLFDNIRTESEDVINLFDHGGNSVRGPTAAAFNTFWNIYVESDTTVLKTIDDAPSARIIGLHGSSVLELDYGPNAFVEKFNEDDLVIKSLYEYQLKKRQ